MKDCAHVPELGGRQLPAAAKARPTIEELREYLDYDPETGVLMWKKRPSRRVKQGQVAGGSLNGEGYNQLGFSGMKFLAHRVAFALHRGRWPSPCCDHIDGDKTNNRADNLRECSASENQRNRGLSRNSTTGVKGVRRLSGGYLAKVVINRCGHNKWFRQLEDAAAYVKRLREQLHGEFARHE